MRSTARSKTASFAREGLLKPESFRTNWSDAARTSSSVAGGSKLNKFLIFLHISGSIDAKDGEYTCGPSYLSEIFIAKSY